MLNTAKQMTKYQFDLNKQLADENRNWQERMANSAHQREIADLKKAGLNPVLSVTGGSGATTPSGSTASVSDGAGYAAALANLETARINSATQMFMHTTPGANTLLGQAQYVSEALGLPLDEILGAVGKSKGLTDKTRSVWDRIRTSDLITLGPKVDSYRSGASLKSLRSSDVKDYLAGRYSRFTKHSKDFVRGHITSSQFDSRDRKDSALFSILSALYPEEYKSVYGEYPYKGLKNNRRLKAANRKKKWNKW